MVENGYAKPVLIGTGWLAERLGDDGIVEGWLGDPARALVDVRSRAEYSGELITPPGYEQEGRSGRATSRPPSRSRGRAPCSTTGRSSRRPT